MTFLHDHPPVIIDGQLALQFCHLKSFQHFPNHILWRHRAPHLLCLITHEFILVSQVWKYTAAEYPINQGSQLSMNVFCCYPTVALACRDGTTMGLLIASVIRLTVGNSRIAAGNTSSSSIVSSSLFVNSKHFVQAGILKTSLVSFAIRFKFENFG